jgi:hypothetical protein
MKQLIIMILSAVAIAFAALDETKERDCQLTTGNGFDEGALTVQVGNTIQGTCKFFIEDFLDRKIINANVEIKNTGAKAMHCQYDVAFFDEDGKLIGSFGQGTFGENGLAAGESMQLGSCLIFLPVGFHENVAKYKIAFYESDKQFGR